MSSKAVLSIELAHDGRSKTVTLDLQALPQSARKAVLSTAENEVARFMRDSQPKLQLSALEQLSSNYMKRVSLLQQVVASITNPSYQMGKTLLNFRSSIRGQRNFDFSTLATLCLNSWQEFLKDYNFNTPSNTWLRGAEQQVF